MKTIASFALFTFLAVAPAAARASEPGVALGAGGMHAHVARGLASEGSGAHAKDHHVVRVQMLGSSLDERRTFVACTEQRTAASSTQPAAMHYQFVDDHIDTANGRVVATHVESGKK